MPSPSQISFAVENISALRNFGRTHDSGLQIRLEHILAADERVVSIASFHGCPRHVSNDIRPAGRWCRISDQFIVNTKSNQATIDVLNE